MEKLNISQASCASKAHCRSAELSALCQRYSRSKKAITVNFRSLVPEIPYNTERYTHQLHSYPAKLLLHIPYFFLRTYLFQNRNTRILDPFCGSGTVPLEVAIRGGIPLGADANPLARLITSVKLTPLDASEILSWLTTLKAEWHRIHGNIPDVVNITHWYHPHIIEGLAKLRAWISTLSGGAVKNFFLVCLSVTAANLSLADPRVAVPVRLNPEKYPPGHWLKQSGLKRLSKLLTVDILSEFESTLLLNLNRIRRTNTILKSPPKIMNDARVLISDIGNRLRRDSVDIVMTSPPYLGAQKYVRSSSLSLGWLDLCPSKKLRDLEEKNIGREHHKRCDYRELQLSGIAKADPLIEKISKLNPLRAHIASRYLLEMRCAFSEITRVLKPNGVLILVSSNNTVCSTQFPTKRFLRSMLEDDFCFSCELELVDHIKSRGLMTKRNKTAGTITSESIYIMRKQS